MTAITQNYATLFSIERIQPQLSYSDYYMSMARQLCTVAEQYSNLKTEGIFMAYVEVVRLLESLASLYDKKAHKAGDLALTKDLIHHAFNHLIISLNACHGAIASHILARDTQNGKALAEEFKV